MSTKLKKKEQKTVSPGYEIVELVFQAQMLSTQKT